MVTPLITRQYHKFFSERLLSLIVKPRILRLHLAKVIINQYTDNTSTMDTSGPPDIFRKHFDGAAQPQYFSPAIQI